MPRGRKPHTDPPVPVTISIPESLKLRLELALMDPMRSKMRYGELSQLCNTLLRRWLQEQSMTINNGLNSGINPIIHSETGDNQNDEL